MDYVKKRNYIAFINKDKGNRWWVNGGFPWDETGPTLFPYDTEEEKQIAKDVGEHLVCWSETGDIEAMILRPVGDIIPLHVKKNSSNIIEKWDKYVHDKKVKQLEEQTARKPREKKQVDNDTTEEPLVEIPKPLDVQPVIKKEIPVKKEIPAKKEPPVKKEGKKQTPPEPPKPNAKARSPLELKVEKPKKEELAPSKPVKKSKLQNMIKEKK